MRPVTRAALVGVALLLARSGPSACAEKGAAKNGAGTAQHLYGTVVTDRNEHYTGILRWGDEEAFWDDLFNGSKKDLPYIDRLPEKDRPRHKIRILGFIPIGFWEENETGRQFVARFGDIKEIRPRGGDSVEVDMKSGTTYRLSGGSNDIGAEIQVDDPKDGIISLNWRQIKRVMFEPVPEREPEAKAFRLFGDVATDDGTFQGFIQWDSQECLSTDRLDGDSEDGRISLEMGRIQAIEKKGHNGARVETKDGRKLDLQGTNDVNDSIRGIYVEDERYGRVKISWDAFRRLDLHDASPSGRGYSDYQPGRPLRGTITDRDGKQWAGRIVFDLDESESWEMLDGAREGIEYSIPFERIRAIQPLADKATLVTLRSGSKLQLEESQDVSEKNAGILVLQTGRESEHYVTWDRIARIDFD